MPLFPRIRRWYHTKCIALNQREIADCERDFAAAEAAGAVLEMIEIELWMDDCYRSVRHHQMILNRLGALDTSDSQQLKGE